MVTVGHFPKKGEKKINGEWVMPAARTEPLTTKIRTLETASDRRNWFRKRAGWPVKEG